MSRIVDIEPLLRKYDGMNEGTEFSPIHFINDFLMLLEQQPSDDCISRKAVDKIINKWLSNPYYELKDNIYDMTKKIHELPPVISQRLTGKWIEYKVDIAPHPLHCSLCGFSNHHISNRYMREFRRCPNCGAEMSGGGEE